MKKLYLILMMLLFIPAVLSLYENRIFSGWVKSGESFEADGKNFTMIHNKDSNTTIIYFPNGQSTVINAEHLPCSREWIYQVCQGQQKFEKNGIEVPADIHDPLMDIFVYIFLNSSDIDLVVDKEYETKETYVGEFVDVTSVINKTGRLPVFDIIYTDIFPSQFVLEVIEGCQKSKNTVVWEGDLNGTSRHVCKYRVRSLDADKYTNNATLTYSVFDEPDTKEYEYIFDIKERPFRYEIYYPNRSEAGEEFIVNISLKALAGITLDYVRLNFKDNLELVNISPEFRREGFTLSYREKEMEEDEQLNLYLILNTGIVDNYEFDLDFSYTFRELSREYSKKFYINVTGDMFFVELLEHNNKSLLRISNPTEDTYRDIEIYIKDYVFTLTRLDKGSYKEYTFPKAYGKQDILVQYRSMYGQILERDLVLGYGESTIKGIEDIELEEQIEEIEETKDESDSPKDSQDMPDIKAEYLFVGGAIILIIVVAMTFLTKRKKDIYSVETSIEEAEETPEETNDDDTIELMEN